MNESPTLVVMAGRTARRPRFYRAIQAIAQRAPTRLECVGCGLLADLGIPFFEQQLLCNRYVVDVLVPSLNLVIQWDGDYFHANPTRYTHLNTMQRKNVIRDRRCDARLRKEGYTVIRFWESDVHGRPAWVKAQVQAVVALCAEKQRRPVRISDRRSAS